MQTLSSIETAAQAFAWAAHAGQKRRYCGSPYICHPAEVVGILKSVGVTDDNVLAAAWLHDVVEDCDDISHSDIRIVFGMEIARLVEEVTNVTTLEDGNRKKRKEIELRRLEQISDDGQTIKLSDSLSNMRTIVEKDPEFAVVYMQEKKELLDVLTRGHQTLLERARKVVGDYYKQGDSKA